MARGPKLTATATRITASSSGRIAPRAARRASKISMLSLFQGTAWLGVGLEWRRDLPVAVA
jgi:hypothetical protein